MSVCLPDIAVSAHLWVNLSRSGHVILVIKLSWAPSQEKEPPFSRLLKTEVRIDLATFLHPSTLPFNMLANVVPSSSKVHSESVHFLVPLPILGVHLHFPHTTSPNWSPCFYSQPSPYSSKVQLSLNNLDLNCLRPLIHRFFFSVNPWLGVHGCRGPTMHWVSTNFDICRGLRTSPPQTPKDN